MPLLNIILRCCWLEILPSQSLALSQFVKKRTLMTGVSATPDLQPFLANAHCGRLHGVSLPTTLSHAQLAEGSLVCAIILDTLGILHSWRIIRSSVQANHCFFFFFLVSRPPTDHAHSTAAPPTWQQTDIREKTNRCTHLCISQWLSCHFSTYYSLFEIFFFYHSGIF